MAELSRVIDHLTYGGTACEPRETMEDHGTGAGGGRGRDLAINDQIVHY